MIGMSPRPSCRVTVLPLSARRQKAKHLLFMRICHLNALGAVAETAVKLTTERLSLLSLDEHNLTWSIDFVIGELGSLNRTNYLTISVAHRISDALVSRNMDNNGF